MEYFLGKMLDFLDSRKVDKMEAAKRAATVDDTKGLEDLSSSWRWNWRKPSAKVEILLAVWQAK